MPSTGFEPAIPAIRRIQTYTLNSMITGIGQFVCLVRWKCTHLNTCSGWRRRQGTRDRSVLSSGRTPEATMTALVRLTTQDLPWASGVAQHQQNRLSFADWPGPVMFLRLTAVPYCVRSAVTNYVRTSYPTQIVIPFRIRSRVWNEVLVRTAVRTRKMFRPASFRLSNKNFIYTHTHMYVYTYTQYTYISF